MKYYCVVEYPDDCGPNWMNKDNLQLCINSHCENKDGRIKVEDYYSAEVDTLVEAVKKAIPAMLAMNERSEGLSLIQKFERQHELLNCVDALKQALGGEGKHD